MINNRTNLNALLIQIRIDELVKKEELTSFALYTGINTNQFTIHDVFQKRLPTKEEIINFDVIFIGGASEASVSDPIKYPFVIGLIQFIKDCIEIKIPVFASCFGFQVTILALGGVIQKDEVNFEMGTYPITLSQDAYLDPVFKNIPNEFYAVSVHQEKCTELPANCTLLGYTKNCIHAFKIIDAPFWAFQFHPELNMKTLKERLSIYKEKYTEGNEQFNQVLSSLYETPHSNQLLRNFMSSLFKI